MKICKITSSLFSHFMRFNPSHSLHIHFSHSMRFHPGHSSHIPFSHFLFQNPKRGKDKEPLLKLSPTPTPSFSSLAISPIFLPPNTTFPFILSYFLNPKHHFLSFSQTPNTHFSVFSQTPNTHISLFSLIFLTPKHLSHFFPLSLTFSLIPTCVCPPFLISTFLTYRYTHDNCHGCSSLS